MSERRAIVRSYQRLFRPDRRIYAIDGRTIPIPGGVPLRWLAYAVAVVLATLVLAGRSPAVAVACGGVAYASARAWGRRPEGPALATAAAAAVTGAGFIVGVVDWPLRLVVLPAVAATALTQIVAGRAQRTTACDWTCAGSVGGTASVWFGAPSGRALAPRRLTARGGAGLPRGSLMPSRITGPCRLTFGEPVLVLRTRRGRRRLVPVRSERRRVGPMVDRLRVPAGETVEVRP